MLSGKIIDIGIVAQKVQAGPSWVNLVSALIMPSYYLPVCPHSI